MAINTTDVKTGTIAEILSSINSNFNACKTGFSGVDTALGGKLSSTANAVSASKWATARTITFTGAITGSASMDGSSNVTLATTLGDVPAANITGVIDISHIPQGALERLVVVADDAARLKLTTANVQTGDTVKVTATGLMYRVVDDSKLTSEDGYVGYTAGSATSVPWSGVTGKPSTYTPSTHTHTVAQISDFPVLTAVSTVTFTGSDSRWGALTDAMYPLTIPLGGKTTAIDVVRSSDNKRVACDIQISGTNVVVYASEKFAGYVHLI